MTSNFLNLGDIYFCKLWTKTDLCTRCRTIGTSLYAISDEYLVWETRCVYFLKFLCLNQKLISVERQTKKNVCIVQFFLSLCLRRANFSIATLEHRAGCATEAGFPKEAGKRAFQMFLFYFATRLWNVLYNMFYLFFFKIYHTWSFNTSQSLFLKLIFAQTLRLPLRGIRCLITPVGYSFS